jgi:peptidoglycan/xylan/chitin deacetylase (PgdA/CDA1 family)
MINSIRTLLREGFLDVFGSIAKPANGIHILNGHMIAKENPRIELFLDQLKQLKQFSTFIDIQEAVKLITNHTLVDDVLLAFTFDDGFEECSTMIAPALEQYGVHAAFFINPNFVDGDEQYIHYFTEHVVNTSGKRPMRWNDILELSNRGHIIGAHTMDHYMIKNGTKEELEFQIGFCKKIIESKLEKPCDYFAIPFGKLSHANSLSIEIATTYYPFVFSQSNYKNYFSLNGRVINRRHFEPFWDIKHVKYFVSCRKKY